MRSFGVIVSWMEFLAEGIGRARGKGEGGHTAAVRVYEG